VTLTDAICEALQCIGDEKKRAPTHEEAKALADWFWTELDRHPEIADQIQTFGLEQMSFEPE
jgi:predicted Abi (CAAX) family protease